MTRTEHKDNGHEHVTETPDVSHIKNLDVKHEASDVSVSGILKFVLGLTVLGIVVFVLMWGMFRILSTQEEKKEPPAGPMAMTEQERRPPDPKLQAAPGFGVKLENGQWVNLENREPQAEYRILREQWEQELNCRAEDVARKACVPIDEAMQKLLQGNILPSRIMKLSEGGPGWRAEDYGIDMPTAESSGRMMEKKRQ
jgi:hypothetical protein